MSADARPQRRAGRAHPAANVKHLMLHRDVIEAVRNGQFRIYPVNSIDEGIEILTGIPAGVRNADGVFPDGSINARVEVRLLTMSELARLYGAPMPGRPRARMSTNNHHPPIRRILLALDTATHDLAAFERRRRWPRIWMPNCTRCSWKTSTSCACGAAVRARDAPDVGHHAPPPEPGHGTRAARRSDARAGDTGDGGTRLHVRWSFR